jgi:hypothetical protein
MTLPVRLMVRTSADWRSMDPAAFKSQSDQTPTKPIGAAVQGDVFELWDQAFVMPFFDYRAALQDLATETHARAGADVVSVGLDEEVRWHSSFEEWWRSQDEEILVTVDDDDFFQPDLGLLGEQFDDGVNLVLWPQVILGFFKGSSLSFKWAPMPVTLQNNWAIRKSFLTANFSSEGGRHLLAHHAFANEKLADVLGIDNERLALRRLRALVHPSVKFISPPFGLHNAHIGSISVLTKAIGEEDPFSYLASLDLEIPPAPDYISALQPYIQRLGELWAAMAPR